MNCVLRIHFPASRTPESNEEFYGVLQAELRIFTSGDPGAQ